MIAAERNAIQQAIRREVRALSRVRHPNVVRLIGACVEVERPFVLLVWACNGTLQDAMHEGSIDSTSVSQVS